MNKPVSVFHRALATVLCALVLGFSGASLAAGAALDRIAETEVLKVAMSGTQQPFNFAYGNRDKLIGLDVDLAQALAGTMDVELEIVRLPFDQLMAAVVDGRVDMAISGLTITADRTRSVSFVGPYMLSGKSVLATPKMMSALRGPDAFDGSGFTLAALKGSTSETLTQRRFPGATLRTVENYEQGINMLLDGKVDGMVADMPILALTRQQHGNANLQLLTPPLSTEPLGIAIAQGDQQLENLLRNYMLAFEKTGLFQNLYKKWFEIGRSRLYEP